jgi:uncharacterized surface protein with fasciclin (FAS1) repeats
MLRKALLSISLLAILAFSFAFVAPVQAATSTNTIVGVALAVNAKTGEFSTLIAALKAAGLVDALNGKKQFTVFAPTDAAFAKLGYNASNIGTLPKATLTNILLYHVAHGSRYSGDVVSSTQIRMLNGSFTKVSLVNGAAFINSSKIISVDNAASNGVIHIIDTVLLP